MALLAWRFGNGGWMRRQPIGDDVARVVRAPVTPRRLGHRSPTQHTAGYRRIKEVGSGEDNSGMPGDLTYDRQSNEGISTQFKELVDWFPAWRDPQWRSPMSPDLALQFGYERGIGGAQLRPRVGPVSPNPPRPVRW